MTLTWRAMLGASMGRSLGAQPRRPNVVLIAADDLGNADLGFQGSREIATPHPDGLARGGVTFRQGYVSHPFCSPTRACLLTGRYQQRFGHENNMVSNLDNPNTGLPLSERTMADLFRAAGYRTGLVGKWHLGAHPRFHPHKRGFEDMYGFVGGGTIPILASPETRGKCLSRSSATAVTFRRKSTSRRRSAAKRRHMYGSARAIRSFCILHSTRRIHRFRRPNTTWIATRT
jgi:arylsulfatase A-like enzyme